MNKQKFSLLVGLALSLVCLPAMAQDSTTATPSDKPAAESTAADVKADAKSDAKAAAKAEAKAKKADAKAAKSKSSKLETKPWEKVKRKFPPDVKAPETKPAKST